MTKQLALPLLLASVFLFWPISNVSAYHRPPVTVQILHADETVTSFDIESANNITGMSLSVEDLGADGTDEIILGNGLGNEPRVRVLRADGSEIGNFVAYDATMGFGIHVVACDLDGDGAKEIVTAPQKGGGPHVRVFSAMGISNDADFMAYAESFHGGVSLACGDLDDDGIDELVTLPGSGGGPHVRVWKQDESDLKLHEEFFAFDQSDRRGLIGIVHNGTLTVASQRGSTVDLRAYIIHNTSTLVGTTSLAINDTGISSMFADTEGVNITTISSGEMYEISTGQLTTQNDVAGGFVAAHGVFDSGEDATVIVPTKPSYGGTEIGKSIVVDLSDQRLYAYEDGVLANTFLVSTGKFPYRTPIGNHSVLAKLPYVYYAGYDLDGSRWDLGNVPWNLRFYPKHYIHYAYWHNNFGHPMSHGCVNVSLENMKWIYDWSDVGVSTEVRE